MHGIWTFKCSPKLSTGKKKKTYMYSIYCIYIFIYIYVAMDMCTELGS